MSFLYDDAAFFSEYAKMPRSIDGLNAAGEWEQMQPLFPPLVGKVVLDLGCGYGWHSRYAAEQGPGKVIAIDQSSRMIATATERNAHPNITYRVCDLTEYEYPLEHFELVISNLVFHYMEDLDAVYRSVYKTLKPGGVFLLNIEHPVFTAGIDQQFMIKDEKTVCWPMDDYFYPGARNTDFLGYAVTKQHHTLTQILMGLRNARFTLDVIEEVIPPKRWQELLPDEMRRPMMLLIKAIK